MLEAESEDMRTIKALPLWQAFLAAVLAPIVIAIVFAILGAQKNALLLQLELLLVSIAFCLTGILARSKLVGLLSIFAAPISWVVLFILSMITGGWIVNPYGLFSELAGPLASIAGQFPEGSDIGTMMNMVIRIAIVLDVIILEFMALFLGFFLSTLATGIWTKKGELSILSVVLKPIAAVFVIILLITVPFVYHLTATGSDGVVSLFAGASEFYSIFGGEFEESGGAGAQSGGIALDLSNQTQLDELIEACRRAAKWFSRSAYKFDHVQGNFYTRAILSMLPEDLGGINLQEIDRLLDFADILALVSDELPDLLLGYYYLTNGFSKTFSVIGQSDVGGGGESATKTVATYNPEFKYGLDNITTAIDHFNNSKEGVAEALGEASEILSDITTGEGENLLSQFQSIVSEAQDGYGVIIEVAYAAIDFLNASYKTTLAVDDLGDADYPGANLWMRYASDDLSEANTTLRAINISEPTEEPLLPFYGTVEIISDMTELLVYFTRAATNATDCYMEIEAVLNKIGQIDFNGTDTIHAINHSLSLLSTNVTQATNSFNAASNQMSSASTLGDSFVEKPYGDIVDGSLKPMLLDFVEIISTFTGNVTDLGNVLTALGKTVVATQTFTEGFIYFNQSWNAAEVAPGNKNDTFAANPNTTKANNLFGFSVGNASEGWTALSGTKAIPPSVRASWQSLLYSPGPPVPAPPSNLDTTLTADPKSIAGLAQGMREIIGLLIILWEYTHGEQLYFDSMNDVGFGEAFS